MLLPKESLSLTELQGIESKAKDYALKAGQYAYSRFRKPLEIKDKNKRLGVDVVSDVDFSIQKMVRSWLEKDFKFHTLLGEENDGLDDGAHVSDWVWAIDPIDGTKNFVNGCIEFGVSIAVLYKGRPVVGAIWSPWTNENGRIFHGYLGGGAYVNGERLHLSSGGTMPRRGVLSSLPGNFGYIFDASQKFSQNLFDVRVFGCAIWEMAMLLEGSAQMFISSYCHIWDIAAGTLLVNEAGGEVYTSNKEMAWHKLVSFDYASKYEANKTTYDALRKWRQPTVACSKSLLPFIVENIQLAASGETQGPCDSIPWRTP